MKKNRRHMKRGKPVTPAFPTAAGKAALDSGDSLYLFDIHLAPDAIIFMPDGTPAWEDNKVLKRRLIKGR